MKLMVDLKERSYPIVLEKGCTQHLADVLNTTKKTFVISDEGVPEVWKQRILTQLTDAVLFVVPQGEDSKSFYWYEKALKTMLGYQFHRKDQIIALGGGVVGDGIFAEFQVEQQVKSCHACGIFQSNGGIRRGSDIGGGDLIRQKSEGGKTGAGNLGPGGDILRLLSLGWLGQANNEGKAEQRPKNCGQNSFHIGPPGGVMKLL